MTFALGLTVLLAVVVGLSLGLLGGGGSILTVPLLTYVAGLPPKEAITASLFVVGTTSAISALSHARAGRVRWRVGVLFGAAGVVGAFGGGVLGGRIPGALLMVAFAIMMIAASAAMIRGRGPVRDDAAPRKGLGMLKTLLQGLAVGFVTGLVGAGGGFLIVPALSLLGGLPLPAAVGTSLVVIALNSFAGLAGHLATMTLNWALVGAVTLAAVLGSLFGSRMAGRIPEGALRKGFGVFVLVMGVIVLVQELPGAAGAVVAAVAVLGALAAGMCRFVIPACRLRASRSGS